MKQKLIVALCCIGALLINPGAQAQVFGGKKADTTQVGKKPAKYKFLFFGKHKIDTTAAVKKDSTKKYDELIKGAREYPGLFRAYLTKKGELLLEIKPGHLGPLYLMANRMTATSDDATFASGEMLGWPFMFRFSADTANVHMHIVRTWDKVREGDEITEAFHRNHMDPIMKSFKIKQKKGDSLKLIDVTEFFKSNDKWITPLQYSQNIQGKRTATFDAQASKLLEVKSFEKNLEITTQMNFQGEPNPYLVNMRRSILLLPEEPMRVRYQDNRVGYFSSKFNLYTSAEDRVMDKEIIHRWRVRPKEEDMEKYFAGQLVEPEKPIVFYVDSAFPEKWRPAIKAGIEDWNLAFEAAGFKNAVKAMDYPAPADSTGFDPDDIRYNCIRYIATDIANASGPSYIDPRSGEILVADVMWYHNVIQLVHSWRFAQTAAVDPRVRGLVFDDEVMRESLRYVASHEVGHTLGLMHNMGASHSFPVDSLRSPSFTQKYGTTPSIMDYARNNFVAQPGDLEKGVRMVPPLMGVYDMHAINWGYRIFPGTKDAGEEYPLLNKIIADKGDDPMYKFGAQQIFGTFSPIDQTEDLGDDHFKAGDYAIANLKRIVPQIEKWFRQDDRNYYEAKIKYYAVFQQYGRHLAHVLPYLGGIEFTDIVQDGQGKHARLYVTKEKQKKAMEWLVNQALTVREWLLPESVQRYTGYNSDGLDRFQYNIIGWMFEPSALGSIFEGERSGQADIYTLEGYLEDAVDAVMVNTRKGRNLTIEDRNLQNTMLLTLVNMADLVPKSQNGMTSDSKFSSLDDVDVVAEREKFLSQLCDQEMKFCSCTGHREGAPEHMQVNSYVRRNLTPAKLSAAVGRPAITGQLKRILGVYRAKRAGADRSTREFYDYQILKLEKALTVK